MMLLEKYCCVCIDSEGYLTESQISKKIYTGKFVFFFVSLAQINIELGINFDFRIKNQDNTFSHHENTI